MGAHLHTVIGPCEAYCPKDSSSKNKGKPKKTNIMAYGIRNAPKI